MENVENNENIDNNQSEEQKIIKYLIRGWWLTQKMENLKNNITHTKKECDNYDICPYCLSEFFDDKN